MSDLKKKLIQKALRKHKKIYPCFEKNRLDSCFTLEKNELLFWFNTKDHSTHIMSAKIRRP